MSQAASLTPGQRVGPYEVLALLGEGGMGQVYRARDARLSREVALKVVRTEFAQDKERLRRFEAEAKAAGVLNHPNIVAVYDTGDSGGAPYIVSELLAGETLRDRLATGSLGTRKTVDYGVQIARGLAAAHEKGIVHRDLKPENLFLTKDGLVKILDFGIAKLGRPGEEIAGSEVETLSQPGTHAGTILGTIGYMSPEQVRGLPADQRSDVFSFGAVLYEMLVGRRAFKKETGADTLSAILREDPTESLGSAPGLPPGLQRVVRRCLEKAPEDRFQTARDLAFALEGASTESQRPEHVDGARPWAWKLIAAAIAFAGLGTAIGFAVARGPTISPPFEVRLQIPPPEGTALYAEQMLAVSPDGRHVAFAAFSDSSLGPTDSSPLRLYMRPMNGLTATPVPGGEGASSPFWAPSGRQIGFFTRETMQRVDLSGGPPQQICDIRGSDLGGTWNREGTIVFSQGGDLFRVPASGGEARLLEKRRPGEIGRYWPQFLPDGRRYLYLSRAERPEDGGVYVSSLDSGDRTRIVASDHNAAYSGSGHLLFVRGDVLLAQAFDPNTLAVSGEPTPVSEQLQLTRRSMPGAAYSVGSGTLALRRDVPVRTQLTWYDRSGNKLGTVGEPASYSNPALSPDEKGLAVGLRYPGTPTRDIWLFDLVRRAHTRLTSDPGDDQGPAWSPDGTRIAFTSDRGGARELYQTLANGAGADERLKESKDASENVEDWSTDGSFLLYNRVRTERPPDLYLLRLSGGDRTPLPLLSTAFGESMARFAPDGRWIAYCSTESGRNEVYVQSFSSPRARGEGKWQISTAGGREPAWRRDGKELFYLSGSRLMSVEVKAAGDSLEASRPRLLFDVPPLVTGGRNHYVVSGDGQRFLVNAAVDQTNNSPIEVRVNWVPSSR